MSCPCFDAELRFCDVKREGWTRSFQVGELEVEGRAGRVLQCGDAAADGRSVAMAQCHGKRSGGLDERRRRATTALSSLACPRRWEHGPAASRRRGARAEDMRCGRSCVARSLSPPFELHGDAGRARRSASLTRTRRACIRCTNIATDRWEGGARFARRGGARPVLHRPRRCHRCDFAKGAASRRGPPRRRSGVRATARAWARAESRGRGSLLRARARDRGSNCCSSAGRRRRANCCPGARPPRLTGRRDGLFPPRRTVPCLDERESSPRRVVGVEGVRHAARRRYLAGKVSPGARPRSHHGDRSRRKNGKCGVVVAPHAGIETSKARDSHAGCGCAREACIERAHRSRACGLGAFAEYRRQRSSPRGRSRQPGERSRRRAHAAAAQVSARRRFGGSASERWTRS